MGSKTKIEWADNTFNLAMGCVKVSEACQHCYAADWDKRRLYSRELHWGPLAPRFTMSKDYWTKPLAWNRRAARAGIREKVFCSSLCDVFEDHPTVAGERQKLWPLIESTPNLIWQLLTKRPENIMAMIPAAWANNGLPENVWAMASTENQSRFDERVPHLRNIPATVLGFSCEPLLSEIDFGTALDEMDPKRLWVIGGGESEKSPAKCRSSKHEWFSKLRDQCVARGVPFFFKQWGNIRRDGVYYRDKSYRILDGKEWDQFPGE